MTAKTLMASLFSYSHFHQVIKFCYSSQQRIEVEFLCVRMLLAYTDVGFCVQNVASSSPAIVADYGDGVTESVGIHSR